MLSQKNIDAFEAIYISGLKIAMEVGSVRRVRFILEEWSSFVEHANVESWRTAFHEAKNWLTKAVQYEQVHGEGSFFDHKHPRIEAIRAYRQQCQMPGEIVSSSEKSSASASESLFIELKVSDHAPDTKAA